MMQILNRVVALAVVCGMLAACSAQQQQSAQQSVSALASSAPASAKDALIATSITAKLTTIDLDAATAVHVAVHEGAVTLSGEARSARERADYERAARSVNGVRGLVDTMRVNPHLSGTREAVSDAALQARVSGAIAAQTGLNVFHMRTRVHNGVVTVAGSVATRAIKETMLASVRQVNGVTRVIDNIEVKP